MKWDGQTADESAVHWVDNEVAQMVELLAVVLAEAMVASMVVGTVDLKEFQAVAVWVALMAERKEQR